MLLGRLRIRGKLVLLIIIPLIATFTSATAAAIELASKASRAAETAHAVQVAGRVGALVRELQRERLLTAGSIQHSVTRGRLLLQQAAVSESAGGLQRDLGSGISDQLAIAIQVLETLTPVRDAAANGTAEAGAVFDAYGTVITGLIDSTNLLQAVDGDTVQGRQVVALDAIIRANEGFATMLAALAAVRDPADLAPFVPGVAQVIPTIDRFVAHASPQQVRFFELAVAASDKRLLSGVTFDVLSDPAALTRLPLLPPFSALESLTDVGLFVETKIINDVVATAAESQRLETMQVIGFLGVTATTLVLALAIAGTVARSIAQRLGRLTQSADRVAAVAESELTRVADDDSRAPEPVRFLPIDVSGQDEVGELARAFGRVQLTAAGLVERQVVSRRNVALMFGHVGRRTQNLVGRQVALIDRLEQQETDPKRLRELYRLDHVSSRLRRSANSLVVLSGDAGAVEYMAPAGIGDVVRLAVAEIEDYTRVDVEVSTPTLVVPALIGDLLLLTAELMENATAFSPPSERVVVSATATPEGARLTVIDHGIGMSEQRLTEENARLTSRERLDLVPTDVLGLFVVGRLARRHGLRVALSPTPGSGVTAAVDIPARLLAPPPQPLSRDAAPSRAPAAGTATAGAAAAGALAMANPLLFDLDALRRAAHTLRSVQPWNAFHPEPDVPEPALPYQPSHAPAQPGPQNWSGGTPAVDTAAASRPGDVGRSGLRRRVPGATLKSLSDVGPRGTPPAATHAPAPLQPRLDAAQARDSMAEFEAGVARAMSELHPLEEAGHTSPYHD